MFCHRFSRHHKNCCLENQCSPANAWLTLHGRRTSPVVGLVVGLTQGLAESTPRALHRPRGNHGRGREEASVGTVLRGRHAEGKGEIVLFQRQSLALPRRPIALPHGAGSLKRAVCAVAGQRKLHHGQASDRKQV
jgi:hypothetical protein